MTSPIQRDELFDDEDTLNEADLADGDIDDEQGFDS